MKVRICLGLFLVFLFIALVGCNENSVNPSGGASIQEMIKLDKPMQRPAYMGNMRQIGWYDFEYAENSNYPTKVYISDLAGKRTGYYALVMNETGFPIKMLEYEMDGTLREGAPQFQLTYDWRGCVTRAVANVNGQPIEYEMEYDNNRKNIASTIHKDGAHTTTRYDDHYRAVSVSVTYESQSELQKNATCRIEYHENIARVEIFNSNRQLIESAAYDAEGTELYKVIQEYYDSGIRKAEITYQDGRLTRQYAFYETGTTKQITVFEEQWNWVQSYNQQGELTEEVIYLTDGKVDARFQYSYLYGTETQITLEAYGENDDLMWVIVYVKDASDNISHVTAYSKGTTQKYSCSADKYGGKIELRSTVTFNGDNYQGAVIHIDVYNANGEMVESPYFEVFEQEQPDNLIEEEYENGVLVKKTEYTEWGYIETYFYPNGQIKELWQWAFVNLKKYYLYDESGNCFEYCEYDDSGAVINGQWKSTLWDGEEITADIYITVENYICREETYGRDGTVIIQETDKDGKLLTHKNIGTNGEEERSVVYTYRENGTKATMSGHQFGVPVWKEYDEEERLVNGCYWISSTLDQTGMRQIDYWETTDNYMVTKQEGRLPDGTLVANTEYYYSEGLLTHTMSYSNGILVAKDQFEYDLNGLIYNYIRYSYQEDGSCMITEHNAAYQCTVGKLCDSNGTEVWRIEYTYHANGKKATMHLYENNKQTEWAEYDENEKIVNGWLRQGYTTDENGNKIGEGWSLYENSIKVKSEWYLSDGRVCGIDLYNNDGKMIHHTTYLYLDDGGCTILESVLNTDGSTRSSVQKEIDAEGNEWRRIEHTYYADGSIASTSRYDNGVRSEWEEYDADGMLINGWMRVYSGDIEDGTYCVDRSLSGYLNDYENPNYWLGGHLVDCIFPGWQEIYQLVENYKLIKVVKHHADGTVVAVREYQYDEMGRKTHSLYYENDVLISRNEYDESGKKTHSSFYENGVLIARNEYDENGLLCKQTRWLENGNQKISEYIEVEQCLEDGTLRKKRRIVRSKMIDSTGREVKSMECTFHDNGEKATAIYINIDEDGVIARREEYAYGVDGKTSTWVAYEYDVKTEWQEYGENGLKNAWYISGRQISGMEPGSIYWDLYEDYLFIKRDQYSAEGRLISTWKLIYNEEGDVIGSVYYYYHEDGTVTETWQ